MKKRAFKQVDVFTSTRYRGNPLAVVLDGEGLSTQQMQDFTNWTNLSEATFLLPPEHPQADYRVRIFCPGRELVFAGHPTLGSCHVWLEAGGKSKSDEIVQECGAGLVRIKRSTIAGAERLSFSAPPLRKSGPLPDELVNRIAKGLGLSLADIVAHSWCDNGPNWSAVLLKSAEQVLAIKPDAAILSGLDVGVVGPNLKHKTQGAVLEQDHDFEIRAFFPGNNGLTEDPVTGSLNAAVAQWLIGAGLAPKSYIARQGTVIARTGRVFIELDENNNVWVGGQSVTCIDGTVVIE